MALKPITLPDPTVAEVPTLEQKLGLDFEINIPGGTVISMPATHGGTRECRLVMDLMLPSITLSLAPFGIIFCIMGVLEKIKAFADAVPASLGPPPDPSQLTTALADLATSMQCVIGALPAISVPVLIKDIIDALYAMLSCVVESLQSLQETLDNIQSAIDDAASGSTLAVTLESARVAQLATVEQINVQLKPLQPILTAINTPLQLIGFAAPTFAQPSPGASISAIITPLQTLQQDLADLKALLP